MHCGPQRLWTLGKPQATGVGRLRWRLLFACCRALLSPLSSSPRHKYEVVRAFEPFAPILTYYIRTNRRGSCFFAAVRCCGKPRHFLISFVHFVHSRHHLNYCIIAKPAPNSSYDITNMFRLVLLMLATISSNAFLMRQPAVVRQTVSIGRMFAEPAPRREEFTTSIVLPQKGITEYGTANMKFPPVRIRIEMSSNSY